jgi:hypothetical protein
MMIKVGNIKISNPELALYKWTQANDLLLIIKRTIVKI